MVIVLTSIILKLLHFSSGYSIKNEKENKERGWEMEEKRQTIRYAIQNWNCQNFSL